MKKIKTISYLSVMLLLVFLVSCGGENSENYNISTLESVTVTIIDYSLSGADEGDIDNRGYDEDDLVENAVFEDIVTISYSGTTATITNPLSGNGVEITQDGSEVIVMSVVKNVAYEVSGTTANGSLKIYSDNKFKLSLSDTEIINNSGPAINVQSSKTVFVILEGTNHLTDASSYNNIPDDEDAKGTFFSEGQLIFSGTGSLTVTGNYKHGIVSDDYIRVREGIITVAHAVKDAINTKDYFISDGGTLHLSADSDGIDCKEGYIIINDGTFNIDVVDDGIVASYDITDETDPDDSITPDVIINEGTFDIKTSEGEGIESKGDMTINDGRYTIDAYDDGINAIGKLYINGGELYIHSSSNDAIDTNEELTITGGIIVALGSNAPESGIDTNSNTFKIRGGTILGLGGTTAKPTASESYQNSVIFGEVDANTLLHIQSLLNEEALTFEVPGTTNTILYSSAKLKMGETYNIYSGGSVSNGVNFHGLFTSGTHSNATELIASFTISSPVTKISGEIEPGGD